MSAHDVPLAKVTAGHPAGAHGTATLLKGGNVIDGTGTAPAKNVDVLIVDKMITAVGPNLSVDPALQKSLTTVDCTGLTVMPGLIDAHVHVTLGEPATNDELFNHREPASAALLAA
jgi:imidazolonepropionase-like amidohydrolase